MVLEQVTRKSAHSPKPSCEYITLEGLLLDNGDTVLSKAATVTNMTALVEWFYSAYWDSLNTNQLGRVRGYFSADSEILGALGTKPVTVEEE
jgi:hypothetical protein